VLDHIMYEGGMKFQPGGIFYTGMGLLNALDNEDELWLCTGIENGVEQVFAPVFDFCNKTYCHASERIPRVHLTIYNVEERCERFENLNSKLILPEGDLNFFDGIFINMISGFELDADDLARLRTQYKGIIYFDVHSLARGVTENKVRNHRRIENFNEWAKNLDIVQANEYEVLTLSDKTDEVEIASEVLSLGVRALLVTKGDKGARLFTLENGEIFSLYLPAIKTEVKNKVGCGDTFGAYFFYEYIRTKNLYHALRKAIIAGSCVTNYSSIDEFKGLRDDVAKQIS
jgi:sugar/nucleoside kinase (ribokinase family)